MDVVESKWYEMDMPLNDVKKLLSANIKTMSRSFIAAGYYMKYIRDRELFRDGGYNSIWEFAEDQYGIKKSAAHRWMRINFPKVETVLFWMINTRISIKASYRRCCI